MTIVRNLDVAAAHREIRTELSAALDRVMESGWFVLGEEVRGFESRWADYVGTSACVGVANGMEALQLALHAMDVGRGDEVVVPSNTYVATWLAVTNVGATPVPVEPLETTYNIDPDRVAAAITSRTRALIPVHLYGQPADMDPLIAIAEQHGLEVLEDAAQVHGGRYKGRRAGSLGRAAAWSFYPSKNLGALGDAGAVTTSDARLAGRIQRLRNYGASAKYVNEETGFNSRLDEMQAAVLVTKLGVLDEWNDRRRRVAARYRQAFSATQLVLPDAPDWAMPVWHLFVVRTPHRDGLRKHLGDRDIETAIHYPIPPHLQRAYEHLGYGPGSFPVAEAIHREVLSLPMGPHLTGSQVDQVIEAVLSFPPLCG